MFTLHASFYSVYKLVGLAAIQESSDGWKRVQDYRLRVGINVVLKKGQERTNKNIYFNAIFLHYSCSDIWQHHSLETCNK